MSFAALHADLRCLLEEWSAPDADAERTRLAYLRHLRAHSDAMAKVGPPDHFTSGAFVFDPTLDHVALVLHGKARLWLQPGGHFEEDDPSVAAAALREVREETGLVVDPASARLVDLHHHRLSSAFGRCSSHLDVRLAAVIDADAPLTLSEESYGVAWAPVDDFPSPTDPDLPGRIRRARALLSR